MIVWNFFQNFTENQSVLDCISVAKCVVTSVMYPEKKFQIKKIRGGSSNIRIIHCYLVRRCVNQHNSSIVIILSTSGDRRVYRRFMVNISLILIILDNLIVVFNGPIYFKIYSNLANVI